MTQSWVPVGSCPSCVAQETARSWWLLLVPRSIPEECRELPKPCGHCRPPERRFLSGGCELGERQAAGERGWPQCACPPALPSAPTFSERAHGSPRWVGLWVGDLPSTPSTRERAVTSSSAKWAEPPAAKCGYERINTCESTLCLLCEREAVAAPPFHSQGS